MGLRLGSLDESHFQVISISTIIKGAAQSPSWEHPEGQETHWRALRKLGPQGEEGWGTVRTDHGLRGTTLKVTISRESNCEEVSVLPPQGGIAKSSQVLMKILFSYRGTGMPPHRGQPGEQESGSYSQIFHRFVTSGPSHSTLCLVLLPAT